MEKKGKKVLHPIELGEGIASSSDSEGVSSTPSSTTFGGAKVIALVGGPSCRGDAAARSNVPAETGGPTMDPALIMVTPTVGSPPRLARCLALWCLRCPQGDAREKTSGLD